MELRPWALLLGLTLLPSLTLAAGKCERLVITGSPDAPPLLWRWVLLHSRMVCIAGLAPLWYLHGASSICSKLSLGFQGRSFFWRRLSPAAD